MIARPRKQSRLTLPRTRFGFTLTELLVVIALIALLIALLLAALGQVNEAKRKSQTLATMQSFANACDAFYQENGYYPGIVPENILANNPDILSPTENALFHLVGGYVREQDVTTTVFNDATIYPPVSPPNWDGWIPLDFNAPDGSTYRIKVNFSRMGEGPIIDGRARAPYFTPSENELKIVSGQNHGGLPAALINPATGPGGLPDLVDSWGQPILYVRQARSSGVIADGTLSAQFLLSSIISYVVSSQLGELGEDQSSSILFSGSLRDGNFTKIVEHAGLPGQAKGKIVLMSAGEDGVFFSRFDGPGTPSDPVDDISDNAPDDYPHSVIKDYDDVILFTGG